MTSIRRYRRKRAKTPHHQNKLRRKKRLRCKNPDSLDVVVLKAKVKKLYLKTNSIESVAKLLDVPLDFLGYLANEMELIPWKKAVKELYDKGYIQIQLARLLGNYMSDIGAKKYSLGVIRAWLSKKTGRHLVRQRILPTALTQEAIVQFNQQLPALVSSLSIPWKQAIDSLVSKGYTYRELSEKLCQKIDQNNWSLGVKSKKCNPQSTLGWFNKSKTPRPICQEALVLLDKELLDRNLLWIEAVTQLIQKGYSKSELARRLCAKFKNCKEDVARHWFSGKTPSLDAQKNIIELNQMLPPLVSSLDIPWETAVDNLIKKGFNFSELAQYLCQKINCKPSTAQHWFRKLRPPPVSAREAILKLDKDLKKKNTSLSPGSQLAHKAWKTKRARYGRTTFAEARKIVRRDGPKLGITSGEKYVSTKNKQWRKRHNLPTGADKSYANEGWVGWADFLGTSKKPSP